MRFEVFLRSIIFGLLIHDVFSNVVSESESGDATTDNVKRDLCYMWRTKRHPFWADPIYKDLLKKEAEKFFFKNGILLPVAEIDEKCKAFPKYILDPEHIQVHFETCYYAKHGFWYTISKNEHEAKEREKLLNKYVIVDDKRINRRDVKLLCSDYEKMNCPLCKNEKEQMCYYAASGFWINNKEPDKDFQNRFFYNGESLIDCQEIWNKCTNFFKGKTFSTDSVHYPPCSYTTIPSTNTLITETLPPNTPSPTPLPSPLKTNISTQNTTPPPDFTLPPSTPSSTKTILPTTPPPDTPPPITTPYGGHFTDETLSSETTLENSLPLWYYPNETQSIEPKTNLITAPKSSTTLTTASTSSITITTTTTILPPTSMKSSTLTTPSTSSTTITPTTTNLPPTSTTSTTLTRTTILRTFTNHADCTIPTPDRISTTPDTTIITTPATITSTTDLTTVEGPVCPTCSHHQETCKCNEKHLHVHLHIDGNDSILTKEVLKTLKLFNEEKG